MLHKTLANNRELHKLSIPTLGVRVFCGIHYAANRPIYDTV